MRKMLVQTETPYQKKMQELYDNFVRAQGLPACENRGVSKYEEDRVFCSRVNDWISCKNCLNCSLERREYATQEW
ncbi:MAG: hypothetical protein ABSD42_04480 [Candidatus Bathyarchaeia archaeon]|jgi:hypothetical protein